MRVKIYLCFIAWLGLATSLIAQDYKSETGPPADEVSSSEQAQKKQSAPPIVVRVTGYGAFEKAEDAVSEPKRLMALRASKLDAFRTLAERVYGTTVTGQSTVKDFVLQDDGFGTVVDTVIRGARVVSVSEKKDAGFETVLELRLPGDFHDCLTKVNSFHHSRNCLRPLPQYNAYRSANDEKSPASNHMNTIYYLQ